MTIIIDWLIALGGLSGLGSLVAALAAYRKAGQVKLDTAQLHPDHGSSMRDELRQGFARMDHQFGEIRDDLTEERRDRRAWDKTLSARVQALEARKK